MARSIGRTRKRNKKAKAAKAVHARKMQFLTQKSALKSGGSEQQSVSDDIIANNLLEEIPKPELFPEQSKISNNPEPEKPAVKLNRKRQVPKSERSAFCELCLRKWPPDQAVTFSSTPSWDSLVPSEGQRKVHCCLGIEVQLDGRSICTTCWKMVKMWEDFRTSCLMARGWMDRYEYGLEEVDGEDKWISEETEKSLDITHLMVRNHIDRINGTQEKAENRKMIKDEAEELELNFEVEVKLEEYDVPAEGIELFSEPVKEDDTTDQTSKDLTKPSEDLTEFELKEPIEIEVFSCPKCSMKFETRHSYSLHLNRCNDKQMGPNRYICPICGVNFKHNIKLTFHMNRHRGIKPYSCREKCNTSFYSDYIRQNHERRCGAEPLVCTTCGVLKKTAKELERHMTVHAEATVPCETCGKLFRSMQAQRKHQSAHSSERKFSCDECGKGFKSSNALYVHKRIHTGHTPYSCDICGQGFAYKCLVKPHVMKCHVRESEMGEEVGELN